MMKKALIITPFYKPNIGGAETFAEDLAKALSKKYEVHICTIKWKKPILWQGMDFKKALILLSKLYRPVKKMTKQYKYDKIYALGLIPSFLCALLRLNFSTVMLALYDFKKPNLFTFILNRTEKVFVEGNRGEKEMLAIGVKPGKIIRFQHWCDQNVFKYVPKRNDVLSVLFVGRPIKIKGKHIIEECEKLTQGIHYEYIENIPYTELANYYQSADVVVVPSLYSEGFSRVVIEAASCGCALITSNRGALPELVKDFGRFIEPTSHNFAELLFVLKRNQIALEKIQTTTALYALQNFNVKNAEVFL